MRTIFFDLETTGLRSAEDRIVEIAGYDPVNNRSFCEFVHPQKAIPADATRIHGITDAMVEGSDPFSLVGERFANFCGNDAILIAHNGDAFDRHFLAAEAKRANLTFPEWPMIDSLKWARKYRPDLPRHTLQFLREIYDIPSNQAHRALDDVMILYQVFTAMIDDLPLSTVMSLLSGEEQIERMPFGKHQGKALDKVPKDYLAWLVQQGALDKAENSALKASFKKIGML